jgi:putative membrane protein
MRHSNSEHFFTREEKERIRQTTKEVECCTIGEVVVMVVDRSDDYPDAAAVGGIMASSLVSLLIDALAFHGSVWFFVPMAFVLFFPFRMIIGKFPHLVISLVGGRRRHHAVRLRALRAFYEKGLHRTRQQTGVLFFISLLEHKVWVLADKGIHEKIGQETLNTFAAKVSRGVAEGRACDKLCEAIKEAGLLLAEHFPIKPGDIDELPNGLITE